VVVGGWGFGPHPQTPNPQSPIPNPQSPHIHKIIKIKINKKKFINLTKKIKENNN
jgi:hypothetical protein